MAVLEATLRETTGGKSTAQLRKEGKVPCVLYGAGDNIHFAAEFVQYKDFVFTDKFHVVELKLNGETRKAIVKDIQFHPVTDDVQHLDFLELIPGKPVITDLPIKITGGTPVGVKNGGVLQQKLRWVKVKALPEKLKPSIDVNVTNLRLGKSISVGDLHEEGLIILNPDSVPVVTVRIPRAMKGTDALKEAEEAEEAEGAEGEGGEGGEGKEEAAAEE